MSGIGFLHEDEGTTWEGSPEKFIRNDPSSPLHFRRKVPVSVVGATTEAGQYLVAQLIKHPWFDLIQVADLGHSSEKLYGEAVHWALQPELPKRIAHLPLTPIDVMVATPLLFSALHTPQSKAIEHTFAEKGCAVMSYTQSLLVDNNIPLIAAEINPDHLSLIKKQSFSKTGMIVVSPTIFAEAVSLILRPIQLEFGITECQVVSSDKQTNLERDIKRVLGILTDNTISQYAFRMNEVVGATAKDSLATLLLTVKEDTSLESIKRALSQYSPLSEEMKLPTAPIFPIHVVDDVKDKANLESDSYQEGFVVSIRALQSLSPSKYALTLLKPDSLKFLAGNAIMNAELLVRAGYIYW